MPCWELTRGWIQRNVTHFCNTHRDKKKSLHSTQEMCRHYTAEWNRAFAACWEGKLNACISEDRSDRCKSISLDKYKASTWTWTWSFMTSSSMHLRQRRPIFFLAKISFQDVKDIQLLDCGDDWAAIFQAMWRFNFLSHSKEICVDVHQNSGSE